MNLGTFLHGVFSGAKQVAGNVGNNIQHPMNIINNTAHPVQQLYNNVFNHQAPATAQAHLPTSLGNVFGTLVAQNTADKQNYSQMFRNLVQGANPTVTGGIFGGQLGNNNASAGGDYNPEANQIELKANQLDPYTVTHEGLHAAFNRKTPQAQAQFQQLAQQSLNPNVRKMIGNTLATPLYGNKQGVNNISQLPFQYATEVHSYAPQVGAVNGPQLNQYYQHYFGNPNFYQEAAGNHAIANATGFNTQKPGYPIPRQPLWGDN